MRVAYDWGPVLGRGDGRAEITGVGRYTRALAIALEAAGVEVVRYAVALRGSPEQGRDVVRVRAPARLAQAGWQAMGGPAIERFTGPVDIVHATNFVLPPLRRARGVVTVHDLSFWRGDTFPGGKRLRSLVPWSVERAAAVIVPTRAIAVELTGRLDVAPERVAVTPEGVADSFFGATPLGDLALQRMGISRPFALAVGTLEPRKNLLRLLRAWEAVADSMQQWTLVLAGPKGWGPGLPATRNVVPIGWVGDETLPGLLAASELFCYPSLYEGFGLPPLEAMATGTACLVGRYSAAEEVLGAAALLVDPTDVGAIASGLEALTDPKARRRRELIGKARAAEFTWARCARATMEVYATALS